MGKKNANAPTLDHPTLGPITFLSNGSHWSGRVDMGDWGGGHWPKQIEFLVPGTPDGPNEAFVPAMAAVLERKDRLGEVVLNGVWAEMTGAEPEAEVWWTNLNDVNRRLGDKGPLREAGDLARVMWPLELDARTDWDGDDAPMVALMFRADFEEEHGFDVLTDGEKVLGTGYQGEATKYARYQSVAAEVIEAWHDAVHKAVEAGEPEPPRPW